MNLSEFAGKNYLLLLFVPEASTPEYIDQWNLLYRNGNGVAARDLLVLSFFEEEGGDFDGDEISEADTEAIRRQFRIKTGWAAAVLVGKDGKEKARYPMPAALDAIFNAIDRLRIADK